MAATILPFSSEVALLAALANGMPQITALIFASTGNILAIVVNFYLGFWFYEKMKLKIKKSKIGRKSLYLGHKYGYAFLIFSFLPIIGDPITIVAVLFRLNFVVFLLIDGVLRIARYYFLTFLI